MVKILTKWRNYNKSRFQLEISFHFVLIVDTLYRKIRLHSKGQFIFVFNSNKLSAILAFNKNPDPCYLIILQFSKTTFWKLLSNTWLAADREEVNAVFSFNSELTLAYSCVCFRRERVYFHLLIFSLNACSLWGLIMPKSGARTQI